MDSTQPPSDLAVDGGQTALRALVVAGPGAGASATGPGFARRSGTDDLTITVADVAAVCARLAGPGGIGRIMLGLTSAPDDDCGRARLATALRDRLDAAEVRLAGDMVTAHAGALGGGDGVVVAAGTGAITLAVLCGQSVRVDGHGYLLGDDGSGFDLGRAGLRAALRAAEGRGPATALTAATTDHLAGLGLTDPHGLYGLAHPVAAVAAFAVAVIAAARAGDPVAVGLAAAAAEQLATAVVAAGVAVGAERAGAVPVSYCGGVFAAGPVVLEPFRAAVAARAGWARLSPPRGDVLAGAVGLLDGDVTPYGPLVTVVRRDAGAAR